MKSAQVTTGGTQVSKLIWPALDVDLPIHGQVDRVVADKEACDTWEADQAARVCGCSHCRSAYQATLDFYATLGTGQPAHEHTNADYLAWYTFHLRGGQPERT
jgi:hypothetical protein